MDNSAKQVIIVTSNELNQHNATLQRTYPMPVTVLVPEVVPEPSTSSMILPETTMCPPERSQICRLCATLTEFVVPIFEGEGLQNGLADKIHQHLPIQVSQNDILPIVMCFQCTSTLLAWHELVLCSVQADTAMRERFNLRFSSQQDQQTTLEASQDQDKDEKSQALDKIVKNILTECLHSLQMEDGSQMRLVCQKCTAKPALTTADFAKHLNREHPTELANKESALDFIKDHVTFEETLQSESDGDAESEPEARPPDEAPTPSYLCPFCDNAFSSIARLGHHLNSHGGTSPVDGHMCCGIDHRTRRALVQHLQERHVTRTPPEPTTCRSCGHAAGSSAELRAHVASLHASDPPANPPAPSDKNQKHIPAVCPECGRAFSNKYNMFAHMKSHVAAERHACRCGRSYSTRGNLAAHARLAHGGALPLACRACGERFATRAARDSHALAHAALRPHRCHCGAAFRDRSSLARHRDAHLDVRNYPCARCGRAFRKSSHLAAHARTHRDR